MPSFLRLRQKVFPDIRAATDSDAVQVRALLEASYTNLLAYDYSPDVLARAIPLLVRGIGPLLTAGHFHVAEISDHKLVGCGGWSKEFPGTESSVPGLAHIRHFATHPDWLRRGIARSIFKQCREDAQSHEIRRFLCFSSVSAAPFFAAMGFRSLETLNLRLTAEIALAAVIMECSTIAASDTGSSSTNS